MSLCSWAPPWTHTPTPLLCQSFSAAVFQACVLRCDLHSAELIAVLVSIGGARAGPGALLSTHPHMLIHLIPPQPKEAGLLSSRFQTRRLRHREAKPLARGHTGVVVQSLSRVPLFAPTWTIACQASLSFTISQSLLKLMSIESVTPSKHLILCRPLHLLPSIFPSIRVFSEPKAM